jgi:hypothetical protein
MTTRPIHVFAALGALLAGCAPEEYGYGPTPPGDDPAALSVRVTHAGTDAGARRAGMVGQNDAGQLYGLKYYFRSIQICESLETQGTAFHNPSGCLEIYRGEPDPAFEYTDPKLDFVEQADFAREDDDGFVDLASRPGRDALAQTVELGPGDARAYRWGLVTWYLPIKVTAEIPMEGDTFMRTRDGETWSYPNGDGYSYMTTAPGNFLSATSAEEAVVMHPNGGSWFRFQAPLVITPEQIADGEQFSLDLTFNADGMLKGYTAASQAFNLQDSAGNAIAVPMLDLTPVPHPADQGVVVETYRATVVGISPVLDNPEDHLDVRLEIYSVEGDPSKTVYGVTLATLVNEATFSMVAQAPKVAFVTDMNDGTIVLQDWARTAIVSGFARQAEIGAWSGAWLSCGSNGFWFAGCADTPESPQSVSVWFQLESIRTLP